MLIIASVASGSPHRVNQSRLSAPLDVLAECSDAAASSAPESSVVARSGDGSCAARKFASVPLFPAPAPFPYPAGDGVRDGEMPPPERRWRALRSSSSSKVAWRLCSLSIWAVASSHQRSTVKASRTAPTLKSASSCICTRLSSGGREKPASTSERSFRGADARIFIAQARCLWSATTRVPRRWSDTALSTSLVITSAAATKTRTTPTASLSCEKDVKMVDAL